MTGTIVGTVDLAQVALYAFWLFFAGLVIYLQRENMREGYPLEDDDGNTTDAGLGAPEPKTFKLPHGRGEVKAPDFVKDPRTFAMERTSATYGSPYEPTGDPLADGIGPAAWAMRRDEPELDGHGHAKIRPMRVLPDYQHFAGRDPRGLPVISADGATVGTISDMWIDKPEMLVRYLEIDLGGAGTRLVPMTLANITARGVLVESLFGDQFAGVPTIASGDAVTKLEEDKVSAYYCGGKLYGSRARTESQLDPLLT